MSTQRKNDLLRQGSILAVAGILVRLIGILYRIPMSNLLGDVGNGIYSVAYGIYGVTLTLASSSLPLAVSKLIAQRSIQKQHQNAYRLFRIALIFALIVGAAAALFLFFGADFLEKLYARGRAGKTTSYYSSHRSGHVGAGDSPRLFPRKKHHDSHCGFPTTGANRKCRRQYRSDFLDDENLRPVAAAGGLRRGRRCDGNAGRCADCPCFSDFYFLPLSSPSSPAVAKRPLRRYRIPAGYHESADGYRHPGYPEPDSLSDRVYPGRPDVWQFNGRKRG